jgi:hypothetical protein
MQINIWHLVTDINLILLSADHFVTSVAGILFPSRAVRLYRLMFGASMPESPELLHVLKPWGALGLFASFIGILPVIDHWRFRPVLWGLLFLLIVRIGIRFHLGMSAAEHFGVSPKRNVGHILNIAICAGLIAARLRWW